MKATSLRGAVVIAVLFLLAACGKGNSTSDTAVCTQTATMTLFADSIGSTLLSSITVTAANGSTVPDVPVWVGYDPTAVGAILAGFPPGGVNPLTVGIDTGPFTTPIGVGSGNPLQLLVAFDTVQTPGTYHAVLRYVAVNQTGTAQVDCQDVPVTFTVQ